MKSWGEALTRGASAHFSRVGRLRRAMVLLAAAACTAAALLYWRQQSNELAHRPMHNMYALKELTGKPRDIEQLKGFWRRSKVAAKKSVSQHRRALQATGGGQRPPSPSPEDLKILKYCPTDFVIDENVFDSDSVPLAADFDIMEVGEPVTLIIADEHSEEIDKASENIQQNEIKVLSDLKVNRKAKTEIDKASNIQQNEIKVFSDVMVKRKEKTHSRKNIDIEPQWTWICRNDRCERLLASDTTTLQSLPTCNMLCASTQLWPQPTGPVSLATAAVPVRSDGFTLKVIATPSKDVTEHLKGAFELMREDMHSLEKTISSESRRSDIGAPRSVLVRVVVNGTGDPRMRLNTDESYKLALRPTGNTLVADITAHSFPGARHGLETLSQLVWLDPYAGSLLILEAATVDDAPKFHFRGFLLDTARNFFALPDLIRTIDAMGACKLNTFHWHVSDSQSFPLRLNSVPQLAQHGAYGPGAIYTMEDVRTVVHRARLRGIRVLLEVDAPAHVGRAWGFGPAAGLGHLAYCIEVEPWSAYCGEPPCGQLNPRNPHVYDLLERIYAEIIQVTGVDDMFHLGGDEVSERCWTQHFNDTDPMELWFEFTKRAMQALEKANGGKVPELTLLWSSRLTRSPYLERLDPKHLGVQVWGASKWPESRAVLDAGFRSVISHVDAWYLDCGFGSWRDSSEGHCGPYRSWQQVYEHRPWTDEAPLPSIDGNGWKVEGGAACLWTEQLGPGGLDARAWPRTAALAERLWSDRAEGAAADVYLRLDTQRSRLVSRGIRAAPLWPRWCSHNPHQCL